jgi:hypothetical protein
MSDNHDISHEDLSVWNELEKEDILSSDNRWFAGEVLGHEPSDDEAALHYIKNGGADNFSKRHGEK